MGHTIYYMMEVEEWEGFRMLVERACLALGWDFKRNADEMTIFPVCPSVEPLTIKKRGSGFAKTNLTEPCHSLYLLILYSASSFGSVSVWED
ncbi:TonB-dependent receptor [Thermococcus sp.]|uniref:TonB-dependent receptor n=1 Tax=Thermococcus sp. TaxID=35749 RepID=UPI0026205168|nr:TonB-dependent receptor [Thermococcus sp.]